MKYITIVCLFCVLLSACNKGKHDETKIFRFNEDIGSCLIPGEFELQENGAYRISGSGDNIWFGEDQFHFAYNKEVSRDIMIRAKIAFIGSGKHPHRKIGFMFRGSLDDNAVHVSAVIHGDGLTGIQYRDSTGRDMGEVQTQLKTPTALQFSKTGHVYSLYIASEKGTIIDTLVFSDTILDNDFYAGIFICSHDNKVVESAVFSDFEIWRAGEEVPDDFVVYLAKQ